MNNWRDEAKRLRSEENKTYLEIADTLGIPRTTVWYAINDESRVKQNTPERNAQKRKWDAVHKYDTCHCGARKVSCAEQCKSCWDKQKSFVSTFNRALTIAMWSDGCTATEIGEQVGWDPRTTQVMVSKYRRQGYDLPYRRPDRVVSFARDLGHRQRGR